MKIGGLPDYHSQTCGKMMENVTLNMSDMLGKKWESLVFELRYLNGYFTQIYHHPGCSWHLFIRGFGDRMLRTFLHLQELQPNSKMVSLEIMISSWKRIINQTQQTPIKQADLEITSGDNMGELWNQETKCWSKWLPAVSKTPWTHHF